ncbi:Thiol protease aleurain [Raphanus sativus]|uniref:cathepsin H n=1 Tax=Raphanus sativus TaxID=3726 RepID=A0A6J0MUL0_RAPSA|nr:thiol protease aleurain-like [Raphanus sativus]XP_056859928.1 thiol protease aleurain-like [Raphanus sativus]KAJ4872144.1 Thiol protease aleurain [Raphanus sativus]KAJ4914436.1 Thiol protease aleurain [Raphanus sativus]
MSVKSTLTSVVLVILIAASSAGDIGSDESTPITDGLRKVEESFVKILGQSNHVLSFARFAHKYGKTYENAEEVKHRFSVFKDTLDFIRSTNKKGLSYKVGVNQFADLTIQELQKTGGLKEAAVPRSVDWNKRGILGPVKNQGGCEASWAFSAVGAVEAAYSRKHKRITDLSEQQLIDCSLPYGNLGCISGRPSRAFEYLKSGAKGISLETDYPNRGSLGLCKLNVKKSNVNITRYVSISSGDEEELKRVVGSIGPVSISFNVVDSLNAYMDGVYNSSECGSALKDVNHYALAVGYGMEGGVPYWLIRNSWGPGWGVEGHFKVERGKNMCGVATRASYPIVA